MNTERPSHIQVYYTLLHTYAHLHTCAHAAADSSCSLLPCSSSSLQRMQPPRTVEELAALVVLSRDTALEESIRANTWTQAFYESLQDKELKLIFVFLVLVVNLEKNKCGSNF